MTISFALRGLQPNRRRLLFRHRFGAIDPLLMTMLCLASFVAHEWRAFQREQRAAIVLERDYNASVTANLDIFADHTFSDPPIDLRELQRGRLYVPVTIVSFNDTTIDSRAWKLLVSFRYIKRLTFQNCQIDPAAGFDLANLSHLNDLVMWDTPITSRHLRSISHLSHLETLTFDATGLKGDWLQNIARLPKLWYMVVNNGDMSDATGSLSQMKELTSLQLCGGKVTSALGPAIAKLEKMESLVIDKVPFDDEGMKHLASLKRLKILYLGETAITDGGMTNIAKLPNLWRLSLRNAKVSDAGLQHLTRLPKLAGLDIGKTLATNSCLRGLASIASLKVVLVDGTLINTSAAGFIGVLHDSVWYPNEARAKEAEENSIPSDFE